MKKTMKYNMQLASDANLSEGEFINTKLNNEATKLSVSNVKEFISDLERLKETKSITRNQFAVSVQEGSYTNQYLNGYKEINISSDAGLVLNPRALDIRIFYRSWNAFFYVHEDKAGKTIKSFQVYDKYGTSVHKVFLIDRTNVDYFEMMIDKYKDNDQHPYLFQKKEITTNDDSKAIEFNSEIDKAWREMKEVHDFYILMRRFKLTRQQLFNSVSDDLAYKVDNDSIQKILSLAKSNNEELTIFIANTGCVQIFTGLIGKIFIKGEWLNVFNEKNKIHIDYENIYESWVVKKPGEFGFVHSLEVFSESGEQIIQIYGQRNEGEDERESWRRLVKKL